MDSRGLVDPAGVSYRQAFEELGEVGPGERPFERSGQDLAVKLEGEDLGGEPLDVPGGGELNCRAALVLVPDEHRVARGRGDRPMAADPGLDARLLVDAGGVLVAPKRVTFPLAGVQVEDDRRLRHEVGVGQDLVAVGP
jgi:hypothetical protein